MEQDNMPTFTNDDVDMHDVMELAFPSFLDGRTSFEREESVGLGDFMDEVNAQLMSEAMNNVGTDEVEQDHTAVDQDVQLAVARQALRVVLGEHVAEQLLVQTSIGESAQALSINGDLPMPPPYSKALQTRKIPATPNTFRALSDTPDAIEAAGREAFPLRDTLITNTPPKNAAQNPFRRSKSSNVLSTPVNAIDDEEDDEQQIMFIPLDAKTQTGKVAEITRPTVVNADGGDKDPNIVKHTEDLEDDDFQSGIDIAIATPKNKTRKSLAAKAISDVEEIQRKYVAKPERKTRKSLEAARTEVPETSDIEAPEDSIKITISEKKSVRRKGSNTLVAEPVIETDNCDSSKPRRRATRQSTGAADELFGTPQTAKSRKIKHQVVEAKREKEKSSKKGLRAETKEAEASEVKEQESLRPMKRSSQAQSIDSDKDAVVDSIETSALKAEGKRTEKRATRSRRVTTRAKSATAEVGSDGSDTTLYYDTHELMLPVEIGDRVVRKLSKEDRRLYSKVDEYDEFTGPWVVLDFRLRKRDKERIAQVLDNNLSKETRSIAWNETLTALVKLSIPEEAQTNAKVSPWVELRTLLPVLDVDGVKSGKLGPAYLLLEDLDSYKAIKKKLAMNMLKDASMNVVRKKTARTGDDDAESSLGLVNLRKNVFVAVVDVDPKWREGDEYGVEKIRKKKLKLVLRSRATADELDQEDTDKWQEILKHKTGNALDDHVIVVNWWVQWAGWPLESCTWEPRFSFGSNTRVIDYYNSNLDIFLNLPIEGPRYPLQLLFDYEDCYIEETRRVVGETKRVVKKPNPRKARQKEVEGEDEEERSARERRGRELAVALFADDEAPKQEMPKRRRPQLDDENLQNEGPPWDWDEELFGPWVSYSSEKSESRAPVAPAAMMQQPRGTASPSKISTPRNRDAPYSVPPLLGEESA